MMKNQLTVLLLCWAFVSILTACGSSPTLVTAESVIDKFKNAGLEVNNVQPGVRQPDTPLPNSYKEHLTFSLPEVDPRGGQIFVCDTKQNCDAIFAYFEALQALAGPYRYQSPNGTVVVQLNDGVKPETGAKFEAVVKSLP
jgi:hypothetical protein